MPAGNLAPRHSRGGTSCGFPASIALHVNRQGGATNPGRSIGAVSLLPYRLQATRRATLPVWRDLVHRLRDCWYTVPDSNRCSRRERAVSWAVLDERCKKRGAPGRGRTCDARLFRPALYQLSYRGKNWSGQRGSNPRPRPWQGRALPAELCPHDDLAARVGIEPTVRFRVRLTAGCITALPSRNDLGPRAGIEPAAFQFVAGCSIR